MSIITFQIPEKIVFGAGSVKTAGTEIAKLGSKAFVVTGRNSTKRSGALRTLEDSLKGASVDYVVYDDVNPDPDVSTVEQGRNILLKETCDVVVALGGGSAIDAAKAIAMLAANEGSAVDYEGAVPQKNSSLPFVAIPTTAGTGSEVTRYSVITDTDRNIKMLLASPGMLPAVAILDPELTVTMPRHITAATGFDALTHAIEAYISKKATSFSQMYSLEGIRRICRSITEATYSAHNMKAREDMLFGQMCAGIANNNSSVALVHAMSRPMGAHYGIPHGLANAILLPAVMRYNAPSCLHRLGEIADCMGIRTEGMSLRECAYSVVDAIETLYNDSPLEKSLRELSIPEEGLAKMAHDAFVNGSTLNNPRIPDSEEEVCELYRSVY
ncbi:MAG TPA: iron-containing alcohol dehydrogenase [Spirochaetota bacterium]|mgnify:CR=1 FL=1|nr:iron-containing alcohol dehydrogenase [Spirochaetota bacterium]